MKARFQRMERALGLFEVNEEDTSETRSAVSVTGASIDPAMGASGDGDEGYLERGRIPASMMAPSTPVPTDMMEDDIELLEMPPETSNASPDGASSPSAAEEKAQLSGGGNSDDAELWPGGAQGGGAEAAAAPDPTGRTPMRAMNGSLPGAVSLSVEPEQRRDLFVQRRVRTLERRLSGPRWAEEEMQRRLDAADDDL